MLISIYISCLEFDSCQQFCAHYVLQATNTVHKPALSVGVLFQLLYVWYAINLPENLNSHVTPHTHTTQEPHTIHTPVSCVLSFSFRHPLTQSPLPISPSFTLSPTSPPAHHPHLHHYHPNTPPPSPLHHHPHTITPSHTITPHIITPHIHAITPSHHHHTSHVHHPHHSLIGIRL